MPSIIDLKIFGLSCILFNSAWFHDQRAQGPTQKWYCNATAGHSKHAITPSSRNIPGTSQHYEFGDSWDLGQKTWDDKMIKRYEPERISLFDIRAVVLSGFLDYESNKCDGETVFLSKTLLEFSHGTLSHPCATFLWETCESLEDTPVRKTLLWDTHKEDTLETPRVPYSRDSTGWCL